MDFVINEIQFISFIVFYFQIINIQSFRRKKRIENLNNRFLQLIVF